MLLLSACLFFPHSQCLCPETWFCLLVYAQNTSFPIYRTNYTVLDNKSMSIVQLWHSSRHVCEFVCEFCVGVFRDEVPRESEDLRPAIGWTVCWRPVPGGSVLGGWGALLSLEHFQMSLAWADLRPSLETVWKTGINLGLKLKKLC